MSRGGEVRVDEPSATITECPHKGTASHLSVRTPDRSVDDVAWTYRSPRREAERVTGLMAFYDDRVELDVR